MDLSNVTACLITRESEYPHQIPLDGFGEVFITTQSPSVYQRYLLAAQAKNDIIYVQDDDCLVDYNELFTHYDGRLTNCMTQHHFNAYAGSDCTLVGWGCFFHKDALKVFDRYIERYGVDAHLLRDADRIFTVLNQPHNTLIRNHEDIHFNQNVRRMWNEAEHWTSMAEAIRKAKALTY